MPDLALRASAWKGREGGRGKGNWKAVFGAVPGPRPSRRKKSETRCRMPPPISLQRIASVARKEMIHILRDPATLFFALFIPVLELFMLGFAIDTNVRNISTVVLDQARTQESRDLLRRFVATDDFQIVGEVFREEDLTQAIVAGKAHVGIKIPEDYSRRL